ncbi:MAG: SMC-Scp complex subunit ScpB [Deltaproteobacteria bacterium]|nr:SMC-Scp complex subunit ScpB [Deltaproteobacteria bacterium]
MNTSEIKPLIEAILFASDQPVTLDLLRTIVPEIESARIQKAIEELQAEFSGHGIALCEVAGGYQFRTCPEHAEWVKKLFELRPARLTRAALEALSIIAYRQPVTRVEIEAIRGVDSGGVLQTLLERSLIEAVGKKEAPGQPILYGTTKIFMEHFHLRDLSELPPLQKIEELKLSSATQEVLEKLKQNRTEETENSSPL